MVLFAMAEGWSALKARKHTPLTPYSRHTTNPLHTQAIYFVVVSFTTIGYSTPYPDKDGTKLLFCFFTATG